MNENKVIILVLLDFGKIVHTKKEVKERRHICIWNAPKGRELFHMYIHDRRAPEKYFFHRLFLLFFFFLCRNKIRRQKHTRRIANYATFLLDGILRHCVVHLFFFMVGSRIGSFASLVVFPSSLLCFLSREKWFFVHDKFSYVLFTKVCASPLEIHP